MVASKNFAVRDGETWGNYLDQNDVEIEYVSGDLTGKLKIYEEGPQYDVGTLYVDYGETYQKMRIRFTTDPSGTENSLVFSDNEICKVSEDNDGYKNIYYVHLPKNFEE